MESPQAVYDDISSPVSGECSQLQSPEDELGEWTLTTPPPQIFEHITPPSKEFTQPKARTSRRQLGCVVFFFVSLPSGYLAAIVGLALFEPTVHSWILEHKRTVFVAFGATLVLFFIHIFPRVKAHPTLNFIFSFLFLTSLSYLSAQLSVMMDTTCVFIFNFINFAGGWQLMICSLFGITFDTIEGRITCTLIYLTDFILVAIFLPSKISDKVVAFFVVALVAKAQVTKMNEVIDTLVAEQDNV